MSTKYAIVFDIGGTNLRSALIDSEGFILQQSLREKSQSEPYADIVHFICNEYSLLKGYLKSNKNTDCIIGVCVGIAGVVDSSNYDIVKSFNVFGNDSPDRVNIYHDLKKEITENIILVKDTNLSILGEQWIGAGEQLKNLVGIFVGTGLGAGLIIHDNLVIGANGSAGEIGHIIIDSEGNQCRCGGKGCLETYVSGKAMAKYAKEGLGPDVQSLLKKSYGDPESLRAEEVYFAAEKGDLYAKEIIHNMCKDLAIGITNVIDLFNPDAIVLGGSMISCHSYVLGIIEDEVIKRSFKIPIKDHLLRLSALGDNAALIGGMRALQQFHKDIESNKS